MDVSFDNNCMKTLKGRPSLHLLLILLLITSSCVPDSLTKFKEEGATSDDASSSVGEVVDPPSGFEDESGNEIDADSIAIPTSVSYDTSITHIFVTGDPELVTNTDGNIVEFIAPRGSFGDYKIEEVDGIFSISDATQNNFLDPISNPGFNFGSDLTTTYSSAFGLSSKTGVISLASTSVDPIRTFVAANTNFNFYDPPNATAETITVTSMPRITVQAPIPEKLTFEVDTSFNCTGTDIGTGAPGSPAIGDVYLDAGTCYYNYDGTNLDTVSFPVSGPVYVGFELDSNVGFLANSSLTSETFSTEDGANGTITYKDELNAIYGTLTSGNVYPNDRIDNSLPFSNSEGIIKKVKYYFQSDSNIVLKLINDTAVSPDTHISYDNHTKIEITPDLPSTLKLVKDVDSPLFGYIIDTSGATDHTLQAAKEYTVTVSNFITERTFKFDIGIVDPPEKLSYSQLTAFKVKNLVQSSSSFTVGQEVTTAVTPPLEEGAKGIIKRILDIDGNEKYLIVQVISGQFIKDASIDNYKEFLDEEAVIQTDPVSLTHILELNTTAAFTATYINEQPSLCQEFIAAPSNEYAKAIVTGNPTDAGLAGYLFVNQVKDPNDTTSNRDFIASNTTLEDCDLGTSYTMLEMWAPVLEATFTDTSNLTSGMDILTTTNRASLSLSAINSTDNTALLQSADGKSLTLTLPAQFSSVRPYSVNASSITEYRSLTTFELQRGVNSSLLATLPKGDSVVYKVDPELPPGLTLDAETGNISGIPEVAAASKNFVVTATNILGSVSTSFNILIEDYFEVDINISDTPKFYIHKDGEDNLFNKCRIKKRDIVGNPKTTALETEDVIDIDCFADIGENNLHYRNLTLNAKVGPGICHSVKYQPYSFFAKRPMMTVSSNSDINYSSAARYIVQEVTNASPECAGVVGADNTANDGLAGNPTPASTYSVDGIYVNGLPFDGELDDLCSGKYNDINCDGGQFSYAILDYTYTKANADLGTPETCENTVTVTTHDCEGNAFACRNGPIRDLFSDEEIEQGFGSLVIESFAGLNHEEQLSSPIDVGAGTNRYVASYVTNNSCFNPGDSTEYYARGLREHSLISSASSNPNAIVDPIIGSQPYYSFTCLDEFSVIQARINLHIRDWDNSYVLDDLDKVTVGEMDEGSNTDVFDEPLNEFNDWDDSQITFGAYSSCNETTPPTISNVFDVVGTGNGAIGSQYFFFAAGGLGLYPGQDVRIGIDDYQIKEVFSDSVKLTRPLDSSYTGATITARYLIPFPAIEFDQQ